MSWHIYSGTKFSEARCNYFSLNFLSHVDELYNILSRRYTEMKHLSAPGLSDKLNIKTVILDRREYMYVNRPFLDNDSSDVFCSFKFVLWKWLILLNWSKGTTLSCQSWVLSNALRFLLEISFNNGRASNICHGKSL